MDLSKMTAKEKKELLQNLEELDRRQTYNHLAYMYPATGKLSRDKYPKHLEFFRLGKDFNERALLGGNRSGKSYAGSYEDVLHLTGRYPDWWQGRKFDYPISLWSCGDTGKTLKDIAQTTLLGPPGQTDVQGTGMIPQECIIKTTNRMGTPDAIESVFVKHISGGTSILQFKAYEQGREAYQGTTTDVIHLDEEAPMDIYVECLLRTLTCDGIIYLTATPLLGLTDLMLAFLPEMQPAPEMKAIIE
jgi:phage terminase large subunit-like protein